MAKSKILVVDDTPLQLWAVSQRLESWSYEVLQAADGKSAMDVFSTEAPDLVLLDLKLPDQTGIEVLREMKAANENVIVIMMTAHGALSDAVEGFRLGLFDFLEKPLNFDALRVAIRFGLETSRLRSEVQRWRERDRTASAQIVAKSQPMKELVDTARKIAVSGASSVLLLGESGTGKDLLAKDIHYHSTRASGPFIPLNCAAVPESLMDAELFGHEKGAFTDANALKKGVFELADGGTLYLDEIGELQLPLQAKLLRVVETLRFRRLGGERENQVDVRVLAATNRDLAEAVRRNEFREDLLYRLRVIELRVPPLRERRDDIPELVNHFLAEFSVRFRKNVRTATPEAMDLLTRYSWPGNVRELRNAIERAVILEDGNQLTRRHLPESQDRPIESDDPRVPRGLVLPPTGTSLQAVEETLIRQAMEATGGNQSKAAQLLGITRDTLRYKLKKISVAGRDPDTAREVTADSVPG